jgi:hypothetical protein
MEWEREKPSQPLSLTCDQCDFKGYLGRGRYFWWKDKVWKIGSDNSSSVKFMAQAYDFHSKRWRGDDLSPWVCAGNFHDLG